jgi:hypothetical protein
LRHSRLHPSSLQTAFAALTFGEDILLRFGACSAVSTLLLPPPVLMPLRVVVLRGGD